MKMLITGGNGFIGSNFIKYLLTNEEVKERLDIINLDNMTYAGRGKNIEHMGLDNNPQYKFIKGDICDTNLVEKIFDWEKPDFLINFSAESHVDRSNESPMIFVETNVMGTLNLLEISRKKGLERFLQISTDEVYGSLLRYAPSSKESDILNPSSVYSASKAGAEHLVNAYFKTHNLPVVITRSSNNYGPYQFPEKFIPRSITNLILGEKIKLMWSEENPGNNIRDWIHVEDNCRGIWKVLNEGKIGETYNISGENEVQNRNLALLILKYFKFDDDRQMFGKIEKIPHRPGHDFRYSIDGTKIKTLGFANSHNSEESMEQVVEWYKSNEDWWRPLIK